MVRRLMITFAVCAAAGTALAGSALAGGPTKTQIHKSCSQFTTICTPQIVNPQH